MQWYERSGAASIRCYAIASHKNWEEGLGAAAGAWGGGWGLQMTLSAPEPGVSVTANPTHTTHHCCIQITAAAASPHH